MFALRPDFRLCWGIFLLGWLGAGLFSLNLPFKTPAADPFSRESLAREFKDNAANWSIGFATLSLDEGVAGFDSLAQAIPNMLKKSLNVALNHHLDEKTRLKIASGLLATALAKAGVDVSQAIQERDQAWLQEKTTAALELQYQAKIANARKRWEALSSFEPAWLTIAESRPLKLASSELESGLYPAVQAGKSPDTVLKDKMQTLIYGDLSDAGGYLVVHLAAWDWILGQKIWEDEWVLDPKTALKRIGDPLEALGPIVLGQPAAGLAVSASPKEALVSIFRLGQTEELIAQAPGGGDFRFLQEGRYRVDVDFDGYVRRSEKIELEAGKHQELVFDMVAQTKRMVQLKSEPAGAQVYYDNKYLGLTPLSVPVPTARTTVFLELAGYRSTRLIVDDSAPEEQTCTLLQDVINWKDETRLRRSRVFDSLAWLTLSIVPPLFFNGLYQNVVNTLPQSGVSTISTDAWNRLASDGNLFYYFTRGTLVLTVALGVNFLFFDLPSYLNAADLAAGR